MEYSYVIRSARQRLDDARTLFRFCWTRVSEDYGEVLFYWHDQRSVSFARAELDPQEHLVEEGRQVLHSQLEASDLCHDDAVRCEREGAASGLERAEGERCIERAEELTRRTWYLADRTTAECRDVGAALARLDAETNCIEVDPGW